MSKYCAVQLRVPVRVTVLSNSAAVVVAVAVVDFVVFVVFVVVVFVVVVVYDAS